MKGTLGGDFNYAAVRSQLKACPALALALTPDAVQDSNGRSSSQVPSSHGQWDGPNAWKDLESYQNNIQTEVATRASMPGKMCMKSKRTNPISENFGVKREQLQVSLMHVV